MNIRNAEAEDDYNQMGREMNKMAKSHKQIKGNPRRVEEAIKLKEKTFPLQKHYPKDPRSSDLDEEENNFYSPDYRQGYNNRPERNEFENYHNSRKSPNIYNDYPKEHKSKSKGIQNYPNEEYSSDVDKISQKNFDKIMKELEHIIGVKITF